MLDDLAKQSQAGKVPGWLSTHPDPGDRYRRLRATIRQQGLEGGNIRREAYLKRLDGMTFGENPREGFFRKGAFYHPDLHFRFELPRAFKGQNTKQAVWAVSPSGDAVLQLTLSEGDSPDRTARAFFASPQIRLRDSDRTTVNGLPAIVGAFDATSGQTPVRGVAAFVLLEGRIYRLIGYTGQANWRRYSRSFVDSLSSFASLRERWALDVQPRRVDIVIPRRDLTLAQFMEQHPSTVPESTIAVLNQLHRGDTFKANRQAKRITGGDTL